MKKLIVLIAIVIIALLLVLGPRPVKPKLSAKLPTVPPKPQAITQWLAERESQVENLKLGNEAKIVWANPEAPSKTAVSMVYIHGFSASHEEGNPVHIKLAKHFGCNLYLARLSGHGIKSNDAFLTLTADQLWESAKEALVIGQQIGDSVILISTSTGGTLSLQLAGLSDRIKGYLLYSPNIKTVNSLNAFGWPWGLHLARLAMGSKNRSYDAEANYSQYWTTNYKLEGLGALHMLMKHSMTPETFAAVEQPVFLGYYYKNEQEQDDVVSVAAMQQMFSQISTPTKHKREIAFPNAKAHVIASKITSEDWMGVYEQSAQFIEEILMMEPVEENSDQ